jgi:hypothetical protein
VCQRTEQFLLLFDLVVGLLCIKTSEFVQLVFNDDDDVVPKVLVLVKVNVPVKKIKTLTVGIYVQDT